MEKCVAIFKINSRMSKNCLNCGHICHCGKSCMKKYDKGNEIECCKHCRCENDDFFGPGDPEYDSLDIEAFNGA